MKAIFISIMIWMDVLNFFMPISMAVNPNCDYYQSMQSGNTYYLYNNEYPNLYRAGTSCRWIAHSPPNTQIVLSCEDVYLPTSTNCQQDRLAVSLTGNTTFQDAHLYCGVGKFTLVTPGHTLAIGLFTSYNSRGGRFLCTAVAIQSDQPTSTTTQNPIGCDCGVKQQRRIVGGVETGVNEYPFMAALIDFNLRTQWCGASILSNRFALTAAHCFNNKQARSFGLLVGDHNLESTTETSSASLYPLDYFVVHESFVRETYENDIAVVKTQNPIDFSLSVGPICLPFRFTEYDFTGHTGTFLGWGTTEFTGVKSDVLLAANVTVVDNDVCAQRNSGDKVTRTNICTFANGKDACQYDSGGPLLWYDSTTRRYQIIGIVSFGNGCASNYPAINTRVSSYLSWIVKSTNGTSFCIK